MSISLFNTLLLLGLSALLLCASQETIDVDIIQPGYFAFANYNKSYPPTRLSSRTNGKTIGPVQAAVESVHYYGDLCFIGEGCSGRTFKIPEGGFSIGNEKMPAVIKFVLMHTQTDRDWMRLELAYLDAVHQLLRFGVKKGNPDAYCIVMPYMGMTEEEAVDDYGLRRSKIPSLTKGLIASYERDFKVYYLDNVRPNAVFEQIPSQAKGLKAYVTPSKSWKAHLIDWGYAKFTSQPWPPPAQVYSDKCQPPDKCVYYAVQDNLGDPIEKGRTSRFSMYNHLKKNFDGFPATVRKMEVRSYQDGRTMHHEAMGQEAVHDFIALAYLDCAPPRSKKICKDYYLVTKYKGDPAKPDQFKSEEEELKLRQEAVERYQKEFGLIHPGDIKDDFVYRVVEKGNEHKLEAYIIDRWAFALPVGCSNPITYQHEIF